MILSKPGWRSGLGDGSAGTFNADHWVDPKEQRRMDDFIIFGLAAAKQAVVAEVLGALGAVHAMVVHADDGLDELSTTAETTISHWQHGRVIVETASPEDFGLPRARLDDLLVNSAAESAEVIRGVLGGRRGPARDIVLLNAAAALTSRWRAPAAAVRTGW